MGVDPGSGIISCMIDADWFRPDLINAAPIVYKSDA